MSKTYMSKQSLLKMQTVMVMIVMDRTMTLAAVQMTLLISDKLETEDFHRQHM